MKFSSFFVCGLVAALCVTGCANNNGVSSDPVSDEAFIDVGEEAPLEKISIRIGSYSDVNAIGLVKLMESTANGEVSNNYSFSIEHSVQDLKDGIVNNELDVALVPCNVASDLYNTTGGNVYTVAVNSVASLYLVGTGETLESVKDLKGKTIYIPDEETTSQYALEYLFKANEINTEFDVTMVYKDGYKEILDMINNSSDIITILPQPYAYIAMQMNKDLSIVMNVNEELYKLNEELDMIEGVLVVNREFADNNAPSFERFIEEYASSVEYSSTNIDELISLVEKYGVTDYKLSSDTIIDCNIAYFDGDIMMEKINNYLQMLYEFDQEAIGGAVPEDDFYYVISKG